MGETSDTEATVIQIVAEQFDVEPQTLSRLTRFIEDLNADSLDLVELTITFEDHFDITLNDDDAPNVKTIGDVIDLIEGAGRAASAARLKPPPHSDGGHAYP